MDRKNTDAQLDPQVQRRVDAIWKRAYTVEKRDDVLALYADWAGTYDEDHRAIGFFGHVRASQLAAKYTTGPALAPVLDVGAGTGAAGVELANVGFENLTAVDMSRAMLQGAESKNVYRTWWRRISIGRSTSSRAVTSTRRWRSVCSPTGRRRRTRSTDRPRRQGRRRRRAHHARRLPRGRRDGRAHQDGRAEAAGAWHRRGHAAGEVPPRRIRT